MSVSNKHARGAVLRFIAFAAAVTLLCLFLGRAAIMLTARRGADRDANADEGRVRVVIDAGHGGEDGGTSGGGLTEKDVNLAVAESMYDILSAAGVECVMTRTDDRLLYDKYGDLSDYTGRKKVYDLRNRLRIAEEHEDAVFVSVHMNYFASKKYSGLQVWYSPNDASSRTLADTVQSTVRKYLQPDNDRETKRAGSAIYLLDRIRTPAILVECGFLSNDEECARLGDGDYRRSLALVMSEAVMEFLSGRESA